MIIYFNDKNQVCINSECRPAPLFLYEIDTLKQKLKDLPVVVEIKTNTTTIVSMRYVSITFKNNADEAYFKILTSDGIDIETRFPY